MGRGEHSGHLDNDGVLEGKPAIVQLLEQSVSSNCQYPRLKL